MANGEIDFKFLDQVIQSNPFCHQWGKENQNLRKGGGEIYIQEKVLKKAAPRLTREALQENAGENLSVAIKSSLNLLSSFDTLQAKDFINDAEEDELKENTIQLLYGEDPLLERITRFNEYAKIVPVAGEQKKKGFKPIVISYLLALTDPREHAFCKPTPYKEAVTALLGKPFIERDALRRLLHCSSFYKEVLHHLEQNHGLENGNLFDVHSLFFLFRIPREGGTTNYWNMEDAENQSVANVTPQTREPKIMNPPYSMEKALQDLFLEKEELENILSRLRAKKNIILQGPPGTGKTFIARRLACAVMEEEDNERLAMIQFHQSYSYEDFIQGFRPNREGRFDIKNGIFYDFCNKARDDADNDYFFIIDEINRGNLSKIFGELFMLIESDKRGPEFAVPLTYSESRRQTFYVPENLYFIGTMNTADRSLAMVDYALRRRFAFISINPQFKSEKFKNHLLDNGVEEEVVGRIIRGMKRLNEKIAADTKNLGPGYRIGHSYFCPTAADAPCDDDWFVMIVRSEIEPLLQEYWFDDPKMVENTINGLLD